ncbi:hypothetical protein SAMN04487995_0554 [Dyadobacter koreensis]|uniref:Type I restriction modification DNA specificity domain-containing protein n=1 Tax=Dyadobacter koreensis TaxID=408657 RepID=A0A1H6QS43_9BACT|nr:hypothetical protein [Dyadobacter koreensis]SEI41802.1 hypothetical protein SAMN04487995_0554 [Dyadobacter koreensis]
MNSFWPAEWELTPLENIAHVSTGCPYRTFDYPEDYLNEVLLIDHINEGSIEISEPKFMKISEREIVKYKLKKDDLVFAHRTSPKQLGKIARFQSAKTVIHTANFVRISPMDLRDSPLIEQVLKIYKLRGLFSELSKAYPNVNSLSLAQIKQIEIPRINLSAMAAISQLCESF